MVSDARLGTPEAPTFGLDTFGDLEKGADGNPVHHAEAIRQVVAEAVLADASAWTSSGSGSTTGPTSRSARPTWCWPRSPAGPPDPARHVGDRAQLRRPDPGLPAVLDAGRASRAAGPRSPLGRGSFTESFPLFGLSLDDYEVLFSEKLDLFAALLEEEPVSWEGTTRPPLAASRPSPGPRRAPAPGSGSAVRRSRSSARRRTACRWCWPSSAARPERFAPLVDLYHRALEHYGHPTRPISMHSPGHVAATDELAREQMFPHQADAFTKIGTRARLGALHARSSSTTAPPRPAPCSSARPRRWPRRSPGRCGPWGCRGSS